MASKFILFSLNFCNSLPSISIIECCTNLCNLEMENTLTTFCKLKMKERRETVGRKLYLGCMCFSTLNNIYGAGIRTSQF